MSHKNFYTEKIAQWTTENTMWFRTTVKIGDNKRKFWELKAFSASLCANSKTTVLQKSLCPLEKEKKTIQKVKLKKPKHTQWVS